MIDRTHRLRKAMAKHDLYFGASFADEEQTRLVSRVEALEEHIKMLETEKRILRGALEFYKLALEDAEANGMVRETHTYEGQDDE